MNIYCPDCRTKNDVSNTFCKECSALLKPQEPEKEEILSPLDNLTSTIPSESSARGGIDWDRDTFINVTAGTRLWGQFEWKQVSSVFISVLIILVLMFSICIFKLEKVPERKKEIERLTWWGLQSENTDSRQKAALELIKIGKPVIPFLKGALNNENVDIQISAAGILSQIGKDSIPFLDNFINDLDPDIKIINKCQAIGALGQIGKESIPVLEKLSTNTESSIRFGVVMALQHINDESVLPILKKMAEPDTDKYVSNAAHKAYLSIKSRKISSRLN